MSRLQKTIVLLISFLGISLNAQEKWTAPAAANQTKSPITNTKEAVVKGQKTYQSLCVACHGNVGKGDGVAAAGLTPKPTDFTGSDFQKQSDGAVFWKLSKGKGVMASYEGMLSEESRWEMVAYLKSLKVEVAQTELKEETNQVKNTFFFTQLINTQTTEVLPSKVAEFTIQHRFGATELNRSFIQDFMGTDLASNIRLAYSHAITKDMYMELGRTKYGKVYDLGVKYRFLQQTIDKKTPVSLALYSNIGISTVDFPTVVEGSTFENGEAFSYSFAHRLAYNAQLIVSRKFSARFSMQVAPVMIWQNLVGIDEDNLSLAVPIGGRFRLNNTSAILFEVTPKLLAKDKKIPLSLAYEIASSSAHAFQIVLASTDGILEQQIYTNPIYDYAKGVFVLGFNVKRLFEQQNNNKRWVYPKYLRNQYHFDNRRGEESVRLI